MTPKSFGKLFSSFKDKKDSHNNLPSKGNYTSTILDKHDKFINGFEHGCSLQQVEAVVKTALQALFY